MDITGNVHKCLIKHNFKWLVVSDDQDKVLRRLKKVRTTFVITSNVLSSHGSFGLTFKSCTIYSVRTYSEIKSKWKLLPLVCHIACKTIFKLHISEIKFKVTEFCTISYVTSLSLKVIPQRDTQFFSISSQEETI